VSSLNTNVLLQILADLQKTDGGVILEPRATITVKESLLNGTIAGEANKAYGPARRTLAGGVSEELDLAGGSLKDQFGDALTFSRVNLLYVRNTKAKTDVGAVLEIGGMVGTAVEQFLLFKDDEDIYKLGPGGIFFVYEPSNAGLPVTAVTADLLRIANVSSPSVSISYDILIAGA
jgi:hypothetical protein